MTSSASILPKQLKLVIPQRDFLLSRKRFNVVPAGRRSGKTMTGKARGFRRAFEIEHEDGRIVFAAPTHRQAKNIFWKPVKRMFKPFTVGKPLDGEMKLTLVNGVTVECAGLDEPARIEGSPLDHIQFDEFADMKPEVWGEHVRPMLAERNGTADFTGTPEGRDHFYELWTDALGDTDWGCFTWTSEEVLPADEIERLKRDLDPLTYDQEIKASFVNFAGRAYYAFDSAKHLVEVKYNPDWDVALCLDFNVEPGVAAVVQEHPELGTVVVDEVYIKQDSNTPKVCKVFGEKFKDHKQGILLYGDATGGNRGSAKVQGSDWDLVRQTLNPLFPGQLKWRVPESNPQVRSCVNAVNARASAGRLRVNKACKYVIRDFEGVTRDAAGDIEKKADDPLTHISDAIRYYIHRRFPIAGVVGKDTTY